MNLVYKHKIKKTITTVITIVIALFMFLPFIWMLSASLKLPTKIFSFPIDWIPQNPQWNNYTRVWSDKYAAFSVYFFNSLKVTFFSVTGSLIVSSMAAYAFAKLNFKGKNIIFLCYLATMMVPTQVTLIPRFMVMNWTNLIDTHWSLILPAVFNIMSIFMLRQFFMKIPDEIIESAFIDGAGHITIFLRFVLPMSVPALISAGTLAFVHSWNDYLNPLIFINTEKLYTVQLGIQNYLNVDGQPRYDLAMAASVISILPIMVFFLIVQKYYFEGMSTSGMKD